MRKVALTGAAAALVLALVGVVGISAASQAAEPSTHKAKTLTFDVVFSPFAPIAANNERDPNSPFALGDEIVFHDQLFANGKRVGDDLGSCVIVSITTQEVAANCSLVIRLPGGNLTGQFVALQGPAPREIALTGGTGVYRSAGGEGTLVEFGNDRGRMTLHVLTLAARGKGA
jgi:Allene oxide cyclase barrel like domain